MDKKNKNLKVFTEKRLIVFLSILLFLFLISVFVIGCSAFRSSEAAPLVEKVDVINDYNSSGGSIQNESYKEKASSYFAEEAEAASKTIVSQANQQEIVSSDELYTQAGSSDAAVAQTIATKLIKNGNIQIEVKEKEFESAFFQVITLAQKYNGYVSSSQSYSDSSGRMTSGTVILRIDKQNFDAALNDIKTIGKVINVSINISDVTQEYVDNESRLKNLEAQQKRLLELMEQAKTVKDSIEVQRELSNVEGQIEVIKGRQNYLDNLIAYSTIEVFITEPKPITDTTQGGFLGAVKRGARGALTFLRVATMVLIGISPLLVLAGIILVIVWQSLRARNRRRAKRAAEKEALMEKES